MANKFPEYTKLALDPKKEPIEYKKSSKRCGECNFRWPNHSAFKIGAKSPCCGGEMITEVNLSPDVDWAQAVKKLIFFRFEAYYLKYIEGLNDEEQEWLGTPLDPDDEDVRASMDDLENQLNKIMDAPVDPVKDEPAPPKRKPREPKSPQ